MITVDYDTIIYMAIIVNIVIIIIIIDIRIIRVINIVLNVYLNSFIGDRIFAAFFMIAGTAFVFCIEYYDLI